MRLRKASKVVRPRGKGGGGGGGGRYAATEVKHPWKPVEGEWDECVGAVAGCGGRGMGRVGC